MITVNRATDHFGNHVICRAETNGAEPEKEQIICVPPADCGLQNSLHRYDKKHQLPRCIEPWKPEKRAEQIPLSNVNLFPAPVAEHQHGPRYNERVRDKQDNGRVMRKLEPLIARAIAKKDSANAQQHAQVPKNSACNEQQRISQYSPA